MLISLTRKKFEALIPPYATAEQYRYCWGRSQDLLKRVLISVVGVVVVFALKFLLPVEFQLLEFLAGVIIGLYWLWAPIYLAWLRNSRYRRYKYSGFWRGRVEDVFITEDLIGTEETVNKKGELVIVENRERRLNIEVGDESGFVTRLQVPLQRDYKVIRPGDIAELIAMSNRPDLSSIAQVSDIYLPEADLWVSDYPYLCRDAFLDVSRQIEQQRKSNPKRRRPKPER